VAYCEAINKSIYITGAGRRSALTAELNVAAFIGYEVETYIGFISEDDKNIASSCYTGRVTVS
jgi:hypothetical protein